jgi:hypothetical protein
MESLRWLRLAPLAVAVVAGAAGVGRPVIGAAGDQPWDPPPCRAEGAAGPAGAAAWYRLDPVLDGAGTLAGMRLAVGVSGEPARWMALAAGSFASGPVGGLVLAGEDDGSISRLRLVDPARGCATALAGEAAVIRSAVLAADGRSLFEHRVDRRTRADLGVWRRALGGDGTAAGSPVRVLPGLATDTAFGPTFTTDLITAPDGRVVVSSCGLEACRVRVLDPATGRVGRVDHTGPALGVTGGRLVVRAVCPGQPCPIEAVDLGTVRRSTLVEAAGAAALGGMTGGDLVYEVPGGRVATLEVATGRRTGPLDAGGVPLRGGSTATAGAAAPAGQVPLAPGGRPAPATVRGFDPALGTSTNTMEVRR